MQRLTRRVPAGAVSLCLSPAALPAHGLMAPPPPISQRVAQAPVVVVGKVTAIEDKTVSATPYPGVKEKSEYHVAVVKIEDALVGAKGLTHIKVGFLVPKPPRP